MTEQPCTSEPQPSSPPPLPFPIARRDVPFTVPFAREMGGNVVRLNRPRIWAEPKHTPEMELILALIEALKERSGTKTIGTSVLHRLGDALRERTDTPDAPMIHRRADPSLHAAVNALCGWEG